jgi:PKD repeat protein
MKKHFYYSVLMIFVFCLSFSQKTENHPCYADELHLKSLKEDAVYKQKFEQNNLDWQDYVNKKETGSSNYRQTTYTTKNVTIVFHDMVVGNSSSTLTTTDFNNAISGLNDYFNGTTAPNGTIISPNTSIQFCLARQDINGACNDDYTRQNSPNKIDKTIPGEISNIIDISLASTFSYPKNKFINIYIVGVIDGDVAGFATLPPSHGQTNDGIFIERNTLTTSNGIKVLVHEMGHYLGLFHTFGICDPTLLETNSTNTAVQDCSCVNTNCSFNGDMVCDTKPMRVGDGIDCSSSILSSCTNNPPETLYPEDNSNFMDYTSCPDRFTAGQIDRMQFMLDETFGVRKSLLGTPHCTACCAINGCKLNIVNPATNPFIAPATVTFTPLLSDCQSSNPEPSFTYQWSLFNINNPANVIGTSNIQTASFGALTSGNYIVKLKATLTGTTDCFRETEYRFVVLPTPVYSGSGICGIIPPMENWTKTVRQQITGLNFTFPVTPPTTNDIEVVTSVDTVNFPSTIGMPSQNVTKVIRVGKVLNLSNNIGVDNGKTYYASVKFTPKLDNCKFRIYYLGFAIESLANINGHPNSNPSGYNNFLNNSTGLPISSTVGFVNEYKINSPLLPAPIPTATTNTTFGYNPLNSTSNNNNSTDQYRYCTNDFIFGKKPGPLTDADAYEGTSNSLNYVKSNDWKYMDVDYTEFANLNLEVTLTFFATAAIQPNGGSGKQAYGYFGIECLGGGVPSQLEWEVPNIANNCQTPVGSSCAKISLTAPKYIRPQYATANETTDNPPKNYSLRNVIHHPNSNYGNNLGLAKIEVTTLINGVYVSVPVTIKHVGYEFFEIEICDTMGPNDLINYKDYKIVYTMLNQTIERTVRIFKSFYHSNPYCTDSNQTPGGNIPNNAGNQIEVCISSNELNDPISTDTPITTLTFTEPCFPAAATGYNYTWHGIRENNITTPDLQLTSSMLNGTCTTTIYRRAEYRDIYCDQPRRVSSQDYIIKNNVKGTDVFVNPHQPKLTSVTNSANTSLCSNDTLNIAFRYQYVTCNSIIPDSLSLTVLDQFGVAITTFDYITNGTIIPGDPTPTTTSPLPARTFDISFPNKYIDGNGDIKYHFLAGNVTTNFFRIQINSSMGPDCSYLRFSDKYFYTMSNSAIGGKITKNCENKIVNDTDFPSFGSYQWEYATSLNGPYFDITNSTGLHLGAVPPNLSTSYPIFIRRKATAIGTCAGVEYSNVIAYSPTIEPPTFSFPTTVCANNLPVLPTTSTNGIAGTWSPSEIDLTGDYVFSTHCNNTITINIVVNDPIEPTFKLPEQICSGTRIVLLGTSTNGISGTWSTVQNGSNTICTFTPNPNQCATTFEHTINVIPTQTIEFDGLPEVYCLGAEVDLLTTSTNGIAGTWNIPPNSTSTVGPKIWIFTSTDTCSKFRYSVTIIEGREPIFNLPTTICANGTQFPLPLESQNEITGVWTPSVISTTQSGTYTFTPDPNQCAAGFTHEVTVQEDCDLFLLWSSQYNCQNGTIRDIKAELENRCIEVCENSEVTFTINGATNLIDTITNPVIWSITGGTLINYTATSCTVQWDGVGAGGIQATITLLDGSIVTINRGVCVMPSPMANFTVQPFAGNETITFCMNNPVQFTNSTLVNGGDEILYYLWDFGDGTTSSEFQPSHQYTSPGSYAVTLTVTNGCGCSSVHAIKLNISDEKILLSCPATSCENEINTYSVSQEQFNECGITWNVEGGHFVGESENVASVNIIWDQVDSSGFGYITVNTNGCISCQSTMKIPVVKMEGTIEGDDSICSSNNKLYRLPQWPTTEYEWTIVEANSGVTLTPTTQRNETMLSGTQSGTVTLRCDYYNTLLGCSGFALLPIQVRGALSFEGEATACVSTPTNFQVEFDGEPAVGLNITVSGPNGFNFTTSETDFTMEFNEVGVYTFTAIANNYCATESFTVSVIERPSAPANIGGETIICPTRTYRYTSPLVANQTTLWEVVGGSFIGDSTGDEITVQFQTNFEGQRSVKAWQDNGICVSEVTTLAIGTETVANVIEGVDSICRSTPAQYSVDEGNAENFIWTIVPENAGSVQSGQGTNSVSILWNNNAMNAQIRLTTVKCGTNFLSQRNITITTPPVPTIETNVTNCNGQETGFELVLPPNTSFTESVWDFGDGTGLFPFAPGALIYHVYNAPILNSTNYTVSVRVDGVNGCTSPSFASTTVTVFPSPIIDISPRTDLSLCNQTNILDLSYTVNIQSGFIPTTDITWFHDGIAVPGLGLSPTIQFNGIGTYFAEVSNGVCTSTTESYSVTTCTPGNGGDPNPTPNCETVPDVNYTVTNNGCQEITITATNAGPNVTIDWMSFNIPGADIMDIGNNFITLANVPPGNHLLVANARFNNNNNNNCNSNTNTNIPIVVPYAANLRHTVTCNPDNASYDVRLLDHSVFFPSPATTIETFEFRITGGTTNIDTGWQSVIPATPAGIAFRDFTNLLPGTYQVYIRIDNNFNPVNDFPACERFVELVLPAMPNVAFGFPTTPTCIDTPLEFTAPNNNNNANVQYLWDFNGEAQNTQPNPVKTFDSRGPRNITLTATSALGCVATRTQPVMVIGTRYDGGLSVISPPAAVCEGESLTLRFNQTSAGNAPTNYQWYDVATPNSFVQTNTNTWPTSADGLYAVRVSDNSGCFVPITSSVSPRFIPLPSAPVISGNATVCLNEAATFSVFARPNETFTWKVGEDEITTTVPNQLTYTFTTAGTYEVKVSSRLNVGEVLCSSEWSVFNVDVRESPAVPIINFNVESCEPYRANVEITNLEQNTNYLWSNGTVGSPTIYDNGGQIQVMAQSGQCTTSGTTTLPTDLNTLSWIYPQGCYDLCEFDKFNQPYIVGPIGTFNEWSWLQNGVPVSSGHGVIDPLLINLGESYQISYSNGFCDVNLQNIEISNSECKRCEFKIYVNRVHSIPNENGCFYNIEFVIQNPSEELTTFSFDLPPGFSQIGPSTIMLQPGVEELYSFDFFPNEDFNGGEFELWFESATNGSKCKGVLQTELPPPCSAPRIGTPAPKRNGYLIVAPNPAKNQTTVYYEFTDSLTNNAVELLDMYGRVLSQQTVKNVSGAINFPVNQLAAGHYLVVLKENGVVVKQTKIVIEH